MKDPVDHILRPTLPWRRERGSVTECGLNAEKIPTITREEYFSRQKNYGKMRTAMMTCQTCSYTAQRWKAWGEDPRAAIGREVEWEYGNLRFASSNKRGFLLHDELIAIAALIEKNEGEFRSILDEVMARREWVEMLNKKQKKTLRQ